MRAPGLSSIDWRAALARYREEGWTIRRTASEYGCHYASARKHLQAVGLKRPPPIAKWPSRTRRLYESWRSMRQRYAKAAKRGGAREPDGWLICPEWDRFDRFQKWAERSGYRPGNCLTRIDPARGYSPTNCRWLSKAEHNAAVHAYADENARGARIRAFGEVKTAAGWARDPRCNVTAQTIRHRITAGMPAEKAITTPLGKARKPTVAVRRQVFVPHAPLDWDRIVRLHVEKRWIANRIAQELGVSGSTVVAGLRKRGVYRAPPPGFTSTAKGVRLRTLWRSLVARTSDPSHPLYRFNGARGVRLCRAWRDFEAFADWARRSGFKPGLALGRVQRGKGYSPANCRWLTRSEVSSHWKRAQRTRTLRRRV